MLMWEVDDARHFLGQLRKLNRMINNKMVEKEQWLSIAMHTTAHSEVERVQSSGSQEKIADAVAKAVDMEAEIDRAIDHLIDTKEEIIKVIEQLEYDEYDFLHKVYVQDIALKKVALMNGRSYSWATTMHKNALQKVQEILNGRKGRRWNK